MRNTKYLHLPKIVKSRPCPIEPAKHSPQKPRFQKTRRPAQEQHRLRFQRAVIYGRSVMADPEKRTDYSAAADAGQSAYNVAVADFSVPLILMKLM
jgi:hypothetical protein